MFLIIGMLFATAVKTEAKSLEFADQARMKKFIDSSCPYISTMKYDENSKICKGCYNLYRKPQIEILCR